jgi:hypothetical protein
MESETLVQSNKKQRTTPPKEAFHRNNLNSTPIFEIIDAMLMQQECLLEQQRSALEKMLSEPTQKLQGEVITQHDAWESEDVKEILQITHNIKEMTASLNTKNKRMMEYLDVAYSSKETGRSL